MEAKTIRWIEQFGFSRREAEVAEKLVLGLSDCEIAEQLFVTIKSIKFHNTNIYRKAGLGKEPGQKRMKLCILLGEFDERNKPAPAAPAHEDLKRDLGDSDRRGPADLIPGNQKPLSRP